MDVQRRALRDFYPTRYEVPAFIVLATLLLLTALSLPLLTIEKSVFWRHWKNTYSVFTGVVGLVEQGDYVLAGVIFFFSMVFPFGKLGALWLMWAVKLADAQRAAILHWLGIVGKWSMLDVFIVAIIVVAAKLKTLTTVEPRIGVYLFGLAIICSMLTTMYVDRLARLATRAHRPAAL